MPWTLDIHHIDVSGSGDATLIVARNAPLAPGMPATVRSVLIDGGRPTHGPDVVNYVTNQLFPNELDVIVASHYDTDHIGGLIDVLLTPGLCDHVRIYDQGWPTGGVNPMLNKYLLAIDGVTYLGAPMVAPGVVAQRTRVTAAVQADGAGPFLVPLTVTQRGAPAMPPGGVASIIQGPSWMLNGAGHPVDILWDGYPGGVPLGAPRMECIAVNRFARTPGGGVGGPYAGGGADPANEKSLGFRVIFGNFSYYIAGDLESSQEDFLPAYLNPGNNAAGRVLCLKTSHHGSANSTSRMFVDLLSPEAAFISCGRNNVEEHPAQAVVNILDGFDPNPGNANPVPPHAVAVPPYRPISSYLTGYQDTATPQSLAGDSGVTAGDPLAVPPVRGNILVQVSGAQALVDVRGHLYQGVRRAVTSAGTNPGLAGALPAGTAALTATTAAEAALSRGIGPAASGVLTAANFAAAVAPVLAAVSLAIGPGPAPAPTATLVAQAATGAALVAGAPAAVAAAAGAAAGAAFADGDPGDVQVAIQAALGAAGLAAPLTAAAAFGPGLFTVIYHDRGQPGGGAPVVHA
jgi:hypothetical protein